MLLILVFWSKVQKFLYLGLCLYLFYILIYLM